MMFSKKSLLSRPFLFMIMETSFTIGAHLNAVPYYILVEFFDLVYFMCYDVCSCN